MKDVVQLPIVREYHGKSCEHEDGLGCCNLLSYDWWFHPSCALFGNISESKDRKPLRNDKCVALDKMAVPEK